MYFQLRQVSSDELSQYHAADKKNGALSWME